MKVRRFGDRLGAGFALQFFQYTGNMGFYRLGAFIRTDGNLLVTHTGGKPFQYFRFGGCQLQIRLL